MSCKETEAIETRELDRLIEEAFNALPSYQQRPKDLKGVGFKGEVAILRADYDKVMDRAVLLRRHRLVDTRAEAVEMAYDEILKDKTEGEWERLGEVHLDRGRGVARAFCSSGLGILAGKG